jgi:hypothetical protein
MDNFDLKRFLIENKLTRNSILLKENINIDKQGNLIYSLEDAGIDYSDSSEILLTWEIDEINPNLIRKFEWDDTEDTIHTYIDVDELKDFIKNPVELIKKFEAPNGYVVVDKQDARDLMESYYENFEDEIDPELNENHLTRNSQLIDEAVQIATDYQFSPEQYDVLKKFGAKLHLNGRELLLPARIYDDLEKHVSKSNFKQEFYKTVKNIGGESIISQILTALKYSLSSGNTANVEGKTYYVLQGKLTRNGNFNFPNPSRTGGAIVKTKFQDIEPESEPEDIANISKKYNKWDVDAIEKEAAKYTKAFEFEKANRNAYRAYRRAVDQGLIQNKFEIDIKWTKDAIEQEAAKYNKPSEFQKANPNAYIAYRKAVNKGIIPNKFEEPFKWTIEKLEQEATKYNTSGEFSKASPNAYVAYRAAVNKGIIPNKFEENVKWTKDTLEQEAAKYNTAGEFSQLNPNAYAAYRTAVRKDIIQNKFGERKYDIKWTKDALEQEASKHNRPIDFRNSNPNAYSLYRIAVRNGIIQDKFKQSKTTSADPSTTTSQSTNPTQSSNLYNNPYFGNTTTTFDKLKENKMQDFDLKRFLVENKMTRNSRLLNENLTYETLPPEVKQRYENNGRIGVAFVKANGAVRHMSFSKTLKAYQPSTAAKTDAQANYRQNNNLWSGYDVNEFIKAKKETGDDAAAAKQSFRNFKLENVLAFSAGGRIFDMRDLNNIVERFGEDVADQLTKTMIQSLERDSAATEPTVDESQLNENMSDLVVTYYKDKDSYDEKGLADGFHEEEGKKVKFIVGYDDMDEIDDIGYIYSKSGKDIETEYTEDDLDNTFMNSLQ